MDWQTDEEIQNRFPKQKKTDWGRVIIYCGIAVLLFVYATRWQYG